MRRLDPRFFQKVALAPEEVGRYWQSAQRDLSIARDDPHTEVQFQYAYQALLKAGIAVLAKARGAKVRAVSGHHIQVLRVFSALAHDPDIFVMGNAMRQKRNRDLYEGGAWSAGRRRGNTGSLSRGSLTGPGASFLLRALPKHDPPRLCRQTCEIRRVFRFSEMRREQSR